MFFGKLIGAVIGFLVANVIGLIIGLVVGHFFDKGLSGVSKPIDPQKKAEIERSFFQSVFPLLGHLAKSDGRISEEEIASSEDLMTRMGLSTSDRGEAIALFKRGADPDYDVNATLDSFMAVCGEFNNLRQIFLVYLITIAYADNILHEEEEKLLYTVAERLGYSRMAFNHLVGMIKAQNHFFRRAAGAGGGYQQEHTHQRPPPSKSELELAYQALGVDASIDDKDLKKEYRKLMSEYHPDKLAGRGVPQEMVKMATERSQEIQSAYELIKKYRKG